MSFSAQRLSLSGFSSSRQSAVRRQTTAKRRSRRAFLEELEPRQVMAGFTDTDTKVIPGGELPGKISELDERVQAWSTARFKQDSLIVRFGGTVSQMEAQATIETIVPGASVTDWYDDLNMAFLSLPAGSDEIEVGHQFLRASNTLYAEPNFIAETRRFPNDPVINTAGFNIQWGLHNTGRPHFDSNYPVITPPLPSGTNDADIDAPEAWDLTVGSPDVVIANLDTGINYLEVELQANLWQNPGEVVDGRDNDGNGYIDDIFGADPANHDGDPMDGDPAGHGTSTFSVMAAPGDDNLDLVGVNWNTKVMSVKVYDDTIQDLTITGVIGGYKYVQRMKQVNGINISVANLGFGSTSFSFAEFDALSQLAAANVLIVAPASNSGINQDVVQDYPGSYNIDPMIVVTSSNDDDFIYSALSLPIVGYGRNTVDLAAPGVDIAAYTMPYADPTTPGFFLVADVYTGTSYAAAHVSGVAGLVNSLSPGLSAADVKSYILGGVDVRNQFRFLTKTEGRLNAFKALSLVPKNTLSGFVFQDANNNRTFDQPGEQGLGGWRVYLDVDNDSIFDPTEPSALTAADGTYTFDAYVRPGTYRLREVLQPGFNQTTPITNGGAYVVNLTTRDLDIGNLNFGNRQQPGSISGIKYLDSNGNGTRDMNEPGLGGIFIYVDVNENRVYNLGEPAAITAADGTFTIPNLQPDPSYEVREVPKAGYFPTQPATTFNNLPDPVYTVIVTSNTNTGGLLFGNRSALDWGDLPESIAGFPDAYNTTLASNGPRHGYLPGFMLGAVIDTEANGNPTGNALGDDLVPAAGPDDEDGVVGLPTLVTGQPGAISIRVSNGNYGVGYLQGWIDFNKNGSFLDAGEHIIVNQRPANSGATANVFNFAIPPGANLGQVYARFRYSTQSNVGPDGAATAGEVEDYLFNLASGAPIGFPDLFPDPAFNDPIIKQESVTNELDVLRNDPLPPPGSTRAIVASDFSPYLDTGNGRVTLVNKPDGTQVLNYAPRVIPTPFVGPDFFFYRVQYTDSLGVVTTSGPIRVDVIVSPKDPKAVDNTFTKIDPATSLTMDVIANDVYTLGAPISVTTFTQPTYVGFPLAGNTVTKVGENLVITPPAGFKGTVQFFYTADDNVPSTAATTATVTVQVADNPPNPAVRDYLAQFTLTILDNEFHPQGDPDFRIDAGELFYVEVYSEDLRAGGDGTNRGVEAAFIDLLYDRNVAQVNRVPAPMNPLQLVADYQYVSRAAPVGTTPNYDFDKNGIINSPEGIINELGAVNQRLEIPNPAPPPATITEPPLGKGAKLVVSVGFIATAAQTGVVITPDPAEDSGGRSDIALAPETGSPDPVLPTDLQVYLFPSQPFDIRVPGSLPLFFNFSSSLDVNSDQRVTAFDALAVINELNDNGTRGLGYDDLGIAGELPPGFFVDTNNDGRITAFDALAVINWLNIHPTGSGTGGESSAGESAGDFSAPLSMSAGEEAEPEVSADEAPTGINPLLLAASNGRSNGGDDSSGSTSSPVGSNDDSSLIYLTAVDDLMTAVGEDDDDEATTTSAPTGPLAHLLDFQNRLRTMVRGRILANLGRAST